MIDFAIKKGAAFSVSWVVAKQSTEPEQGCSHAQYIQDGGTRHQGVCSRSSVASTKRNKTMSVDLYELKKTLSDGKGRYVSEDNKPIDDHWADQILAMTLFFSDVDPIIRNSPMTVQDKNRTAMEIIEGIAEAAKEGQATNRMMRWKDIVEKTNETQTVPDSIKWDGKPL
jgi:hypothetical protein